jgi:O-antigen/teichoic acid export membrane protein
MINKPAETRSGQLLRSGVLLSVVSLATGGANYAFQAIMGRQLSTAEYGYLNTTLGLIGLLSLPLLIASNAVTHYVAHFRAQGNEAHLSGLLLGCRRFLLRLTVAGSLLAVLLVKPLSDFFRFPRPLLMVVAVICVMASLWGTFAATLCQGMSWFRRLAAIGLTGAVLRLLFGYGCTLKWASAEPAVLASAVALLANLALLFWKRDLAWRGPTESPWGWDFGRYLVAAAACVGGSYCFTQSDLLVAQRYFPKDTVGYYSAAGVLARALPMVVAPLLTVLFTSRSGHRTGGVVREQFKLLGLYAAGLVVGASLLILLRAICVRLLLGTATPESVALVGRLAVTMMFVGLLQGLGMWALASRWLRVTIIYGVVGLAYSLMLLWRGTSLAALLQIMPLAAGAALVLVLAAWTFSVRQAGNVA